MPELPEVETVRRGVHDAVIGRTIATVTVTHPRAVRRHPGGADAFGAALVGRRVEGTARRGKYLWLTLSPPNAARRISSPPSALLAHLGMSGQLLVQAPSAPEQAHLRVRLSFADAGHELRFIDQRTFGGLAVTGLVRDEQGSSSGRLARPVPVPAPIAHIAADPLEPAFDERHFLDAVRRRRTGLKRALLDQSLVSGIGNIYADEALWAARLHYARPTETTPRPALRSLLGAVRDVFAAALAHGGTSFDSLYVNVNGQSGYFDRSLAVYGREGEPCRRCGTAVRRDAFMNRSSYSCPACQPRPRRARW